MESKNRLWTFAEKQVFFLHNFKLSTGVDLNKCPNCAPISDLPSYITTINFCMVILQAMLPNALKTS